MTQKPYKIMVVDDEPDVRSSCCRILEPEGYIVETAANGHDGFELYEKNKDFAAALIDLKMPGMNGIELIEKIHNIDKDILLFVVTGYATIETACRGNKARGL